VPNCRGKNFNLCANQQFGGSLLLKHLQKSWELEPSVDWKQD